MTTVASPVRTRSSRRGWVGLFAVVALGLVAAVVLVRGSSAPPAPLSPTSTAADGAQAVARLLQARGTASRQVSSLAAARGDQAVLVLSPDSYTPTQLAGLASSVSGPLILLSPDSSLLAPLGIDATGGSSPAPSSGPPVREVPANCSLEAATAAGPVAFEAAAISYHGSGGQFCYGGRVVATPRVVILSDPTLLTNARLADPGVAALDLNLLGTTTSLVWLRPGVDAGGGTGSVWDALPPGSGWAALWALLVGGLVAVWRGRRLGAPISEPLPVVVRGSELVRGRARLYARIGARERAAELIRAGAVSRLRSQLGQPASAPLAVVEHAVAAELARRGERLTPGLLTGPVPTDDEALARLAHELAAVRAHLGGEPHDPAAG